MTVANVSKDIENRTLTVTAEYAASAERVWRLWSDPRRLERWWGPPGYPATVTEHALTPGGRVAYFMTGPDGEHYAGGWRVLAVDPPRRLVVEDYFANEDGGENLEMPGATMVVTIDEAGAATRMTITSTWESVEAMQRVLDMGVEEGIRGALGQIGRAARRGGGLSPGRAAGRAPRDVVADLRREHGGDIVVLSSVSVIRDLLDADEVDRLSITRSPVTGAAANASSTTPLPGPVIGAGRLRGWGERGDLQCLRSQPLWDGCPVAADAQEDLTIIECPRRNPRTVGA